MTSAQVVRDFDFQQLHWPRFTIVDVNLSDDSLTDLLHSLLVGDCCQAA